MTISIYETNPKKSIRDRLRALKGRSRAIYLAAIDSAALRELPDSYVSPGGLTKSDLREKLERFGSCASLVEMVPDAGKPDRVRRANYCHVNCACPVCSGRLGAMRRRSLEHKIKAATGLWQNVYLVTFTMADAADLHNQLSDFKTAFSRFRKMGERRGKRFRGLGEWSKIRGGFLSWEVKRGQGSGLWHSHIHAMLFASEPLDYEAHKIDSLGRRASKLSLEWFSATRGSGISIRADKLSRIPRRQAAWTNRKWERIVSRYSPLSWSESVFLQSCEVTKYTSLLDERSPDDLVTVIANAHGFRFWSRLGAFLRTSTAEQLEREEKPPTVIDPVGSYTLLWSDSESDYLSPKRTESPDRENRSLLAEMARAQGSYRAARAGLLAGSFLPCPDPGLAAALDALKGAFRASVGHLVANHVRAHSRGVFPWTLADHRAALAGRIAELWATGPECSILELEPAPG